MLKREPLPLFLFPPIFWKCYVCEQHLHRPPQRDGQVSHRNCIHGQGNLDEGMLPFSFLRMQLC